MIRKIIQINSTALLASPIKNILINKYYKITFLKIAEIELSDY